MAWVQNRYFGLPADWFYQWITIGGTKTQTFIIERDLIVIAMCLPFAFGLLAIAALAGDEVIQYRLVGMDHALKGPLLYIVLFCKLGFVVSILWIAITIYDLFAEGLKL